MLGKLLKYEIKATGRTFLPLYGALLIVALITNLFSHSQVGMGFTIMTMILFGLFVALGVMTILLLIQRFNKNLLGDEGYLMFTLPVTSYNLILSKLIVTVFWTFISGCVSILTFILLFGGLDFTFFKEFFSVLFTQMDILLNTLSEALKNELFREGVYTIIGACFMMLMSYIGFVLIIYLSLSLAQLPIFSKHRGIISFIAFFIINTVLQASVVFISNELMTLIEPTMGGAMLITVLTVLAFDILLFFMINYLLNKHLNLE